jgi:hypothetical protein
MIFKGMTPPCTIIFPLPYINGLMLLFEQNSGKVNALRSDALKSTKEGDGGGIWIPQES